MPVLAIYGGDAELVGQATWLESLLPSCTTVVVAGQGHWLLVNRAALVGELILDWLPGHRG
jgi:pimeloyl-ACP methyl ester carboxylesterase